MTKREKTIGLFVLAAAGLYAVDAVLLGPQFDRLDAAEGKSSTHRQKLADAEAIIQRSKTAARLWRPMAGERVKPDAPSAESQLREGVLAAAREANLTVPNYQSDKAEKEQGYERSQITLTATGTMRQVSRFLFNVQTSETPIRVETAQIKSRTDGVDDLQLQVKLSTIYQPAGGPKLASAGRTFGGL